MRRPALDRRTLWTLLAGNALTEVGILFFLPILPLYVHSRGGSALLVGTIFASGVIARALAQYPAGWLSDRWGRRPVIVGSLLLYAILFPLYALPVPPAALIGLRFVQALVGGAYLPASLALAADLTPLDRRGRVFSQLRASDMFGVLVGPVLGGAVAGLRLDYVFFAGAAICAAAALLLLRLPAAPVRPAGDDESEEGRPVRPLRLLWLLLPVVALGAPVMWTFGTYDTIWSLYLTSRGANTFLVGLSYGTYALPILLFAGLAGGLADRLGHMRAGTLSLLTFGLLASVYPLVASVPALILIGFAEGTLTAAGVPALNAEISRRAPAGAQGRTQGLYQLTLNGAEVVGAVGSGALYGLRPAYAFFAITAACLAGVGASLLLRRAQDQGGASSVPRTSAQR
jgi:DHA1 family tetracycline resistance protein-like MFS transporter